MTQNRKAEMKMGRANARARDVGYRRSTTVSRFVAGGSLVLTAAFAWIAAKSFSGHPASATTTRARSTVARRAPRVSDDDGFTPPASPPSNNDGFNPPTVSGGS